MPGLHLLTTLALALFAGATIHAANRPNILFILADDVGREVLGCYGGRTYETPGLDRLAEGGMRFTHCYAMPVCHPTRVCLLTGRYPAVLGNPRWGSFPKADEKRTFAEMLKRAGYATAVAGKWQLSLMKKDKQQPRRMGFDEWSLFGWHEGPRYHDPFIYENGRLREDTKGKYGPDLYTDFLIQFMEKHRDGPFLAYYSMALAHDVTDDIGKPVPYAPSGTWLTYKEMAEDMDRQIGKLLAALDRLKLRENTLVLYTTDNGTAAASYLKVGPDGKFVRPKVYSYFNGRMVQGGKGKMNDLGTRVPMIASWPGVIEPGQVVDDLVDFSDILPTFAEIGGAALPDVPLNGVSFAGRLLGRGVSPREWAYAETGRSQNRYVRTRDFKLYGDGRFHDMNADPDEKKPLRAVPEEARAIHDRLRQALAALPIPKGKPH